MNTPRPFPSADPSAAGPQGERAAASTAPPWTVIALLAAITALGPFSMQAISPGLPVLAAAMAISEGAAQTLISVAMLAMALSAAFYGPLADHFGRRPVLIVSLALAAAGATLATVAPAFELVLLGRVAQSVGAGAGMVLARAAARDLFGERGAAEAIAKITAFMVAAPMIAPAIGGVLTELFGWRGVFGAIAAASLMLLLVVRRRFGETATTLSPELKLGAAIGDFGAILRRRAFLGPAAYCGASLMSFFLFVSAGPYVMHWTYQVGPAAYGLLFAIGALTYMGANLASPKVAARIGPRNAILVGGAIALIGCGLMAALLALRGGPPEDLEGMDWIGAIALMITVSFNAIGSGLATPNAMAAAVSAYPERAGSASALVSVAQFGGGAVAAQAATLLPFDSGWPLAAAMTGCAFVALSAYLAFSRW